MRHNRLVPQGKQSLGERSLQQPNNFSQRTNGMKEVRDGKRPLGMRVWRHTPTCRYPRLGGGWGEGRKPHPTPPQTAPFPGESSSPAGGGRSRRHLPTSSQPCSRPEIGGARRARPATRVSPGEPGPRPQQGSSLARLATSPPRPLPGGAGLSHRRTGS